MRKNIGNNIQRSSISVRVTQTQIFFHNVANSRRKQNNTSHLTNIDLGAIVHDHQSMCDVVKAYFSKLFSTGIPNVDATVHLVDRKLNDDDNIPLLASLTHQEFEKAIFQMHNDKSPRPKDLNPTFYKKSLLKKLLFTTSYLPRSYENVLVCIRMAIL